MTHVRLTWILLSLVYAATSMAAQWRSSHLNAVTIALPTTRILRWNFVGLLVLGITFSVGWRFAVYI